ncbi:MAG: YciI family protein [Solirubrobacteraceae bacterium]|nr:YciI family protein [Solirubrobacteraceae bacterium]
MKVMVFVQMQPKDETGAMPSDELLAAMSAYNDELVTAGVMLEVGGLTPTAEGARVAFSGGTTSVVDGPFTESKEIVVGYWVWEVGSLEEAVEWARRCPSDPNDASTSWLELRPCISLEDFAERFDEEPAA